MPVITNRELAPVKEIVVKSDGDTGNAIKIQLDRGLYGFHFMEHSSQGFNPYDRKTALNLNRESLQGLIQALQALYFQGV